MEACKVCVEPCRACGLDPHDPCCGVCGGIHDAAERHVGVAYATCERCGRTVQARGSGDGRSCPTGS